MLARWTGGDREGFEGFLEKISAGIWAAVDEFGGTSVKNLGSDFLRGTLGIGGILRNSLWVRND